MMTSDERPRLAPFHSDRKPRILICAVQIPFISGGAERHIQSLQAELIKRNYETDVIKLPFKWYPPRQIINDALAWRFVDLTDSYGLPVDMVIATRFPSYVVKHPRKIAWVLHQHRQVYDLLTTPLTDFKDDVDSDHVREMIYRLDRTALQECRHIFANSKNVSARMKKYLNIESVPLYHPPPQNGLYRWDCQGDFILSVSRLELNKRVHLLISALASAKRKIRAIIVGTGPQDANLRNQASQLGIADRIEFAGFISDEELLRLYAECGAVYYAPLDEDYGYVTLEAFLSGKPIITTNDSGGVLEFAKADQTAFVASPDAESIAAACDAWSSNPEIGQRFGASGLKIAKTISWDNVISQLTACLDHEH